MNWLSMTDAPKGSYEPTTKMVKGKEITTSVFVPVTIWTASSCGRVLESYWMPDVNRWHRYGKGETPIGFMHAVKDSPAPKHPYELEAA